MKRMFYLFWLFILAVLSSSAQVIPISSARSGAKGDTVTVAGIITNGPELGVIRYLQDGTGGIAAYSSIQLSSVMRGDSVVIKGVIAPYHNLMELNPVLSANVISSGNRLPDPAVFSAVDIPTAFSETYESMLVEITGLTITGSGTFSGNTNYNLNEITPYHIRVNSASTGGDTGIVGKPIPTGDVSVIGILSQYCLSPALGCNSGYELLPRLYEDFILNAAPNVSSALGQQSITQTSFTVTFETRNSGTTDLEYGLTPDLGCFVSDTHTTTNHVINLTGLLPATVYYVKASSSNAEGTSYSQVVPMITASNSSGKITIYFNNTVNTSYAYSGNEAVQLNTTIDDTLIAYINRAKYSLDIALYNWGTTGLSDITGAVNAACNRGVNVRVIVNGTTSNYGLDNLNHGINRLKSPTSSAYGIMHNKFMIIDAGSSDPDDAIVWTGSTNWTDQQINHDRNNVIIFQDQSMAKVYTMEFEEMWGSTTLVPNLPVSKFGPDKTDNTPHHFKLKETDVEVYFSPSDDPITRLIHTVDAANNDLNASIMEITRNDVAMAISKQYQAITLPNCSNVIVNDTSSSTGPYYILVNAVGNDHVYIYSGRYMYHHKYLIADALDASSDPTLWTGSMNWTYSGGQRNDENSVVVHSASLVNQFYQEFAQRLLDEGSKPCMVSITGFSSAYSSNEINAYPNPSDGLIYFTLPENFQATTVKVLDTSGISVGVYDLNDNKLDISGLPSGLYFIELSNANRQFRFKVAIK